MELKKKTIIGEDNNEPPKDYIGIKSDGKAYEFDYNNRKGKESQIVSSINSGNSGTSLTGNLLDDWVFGITQGEYTKYEDIPSGILGENSGWRKWPEGEARLGAFKADGYLTLRDNAEDPSRQKEYNILLDPVFTTVVPKW